MRATGGARLLEALPAYIEEDLDARQPVIQVSFVPRKASDDRAVHSRDQWELSQPAEGGVVLVAWNALEGVHECHT